ncbi:hypothetical protein [Halocatena marina]|uniref:hypothetical protein n=1 Tax=Halocatena marina TaxID=2934937 RepID=UPI00403A142E
MHVEDGTRLRIVQLRRLQRPYVAIRTIDVAAGYCLAVENAASSAPCSPGSQAVADRLSSWRQTRVGTRSKDCYSVEGAGNSVRVNCKTVHTRSISLAQSAISREVTSM